MIRGQHASSRSVASGPLIPQDAKGEEAPPPSKKTPSSKKKPRLTDRERGKIEGLHEDGLSAIAKKAGR
ncbi:hypothetical protein PC119_g23636 [Phytophthora cactorum]|uniref:Uncharacterized protein n=1 Tax=Phytophthora cactorum TaxID=29920 RepID=A0A8T1B3R0_9STRA|nr:hypothetical protein PC117_g24000 [Phytophthora cactorum]KAG2970526.1 hypothetical protein PC119_g23636 [Phytophthora cactorum]